MNNLLDTHTFLWFLDDAPELSKRAKAIIENPQNKNHVSIASLFEIAIKTSLGKLNLEIPFAKLQNEAEKNGFQILPITFEDTLRLSALPFHHRDPFDRIIISQALGGNLTLLSRDANFKKYGVNLLW